MDQLVAWLKAFIAWFSSPFKTMLSLMALSAVALFLPAAWQQNMGIFQWTQDHRVVEWGLFLFCGVFSLLSGGEHALTRRTMKQKIHRMHDDEKAIIARFEGSKRGTIMAWPHEGGIGSLVASGIIVKVESALNNGMDAYRLSALASKYVK